MMDILSIAGNIASLVGVVISCYVVWDLQKIKKQFIFKARIPDLIKALEEHVKQLSASINTDDIRAIEQIISITNPVLDNLSKKVHSDIRKNINILIEEIQAYDSMSNKELKSGKDKAYKIHNSMLSIVEALKQQHEDSKWSY